MAFISTLRVLTAFAVERKHRLLLGRLNRLSAAIAIEALRLRLKNLQGTEFLDLLSVRASTLLRVDRFAVKRKHRLLTWGCLSWALPTPARN